MLRGIHNKLGSAGLIVAVCAVVLAVGGTALAASGALSGKQKKEVEKIAKKFQGTGPAGAKGDPGTAGTNGKDGTNGTNGTDGKNAEAVPFSGSKGTIGGVTCSEGGLEVKSATATTLVCNGAKGTNGTTGFTETLPPGKTETGSWGAKESANAGAVLVPISFDIPLSEAPEAVVVKQGETEAEGCPGLKNGLPTADPGVLCIYTVFETGATVEGGFNPSGELFEENPGPTGFVLNVEHESFYVIYGSWAVTAAS